MKKNLKIILISAMIASNSILMSGCSTNQNNTKIEANKKGGYLESDITIPEELVFISKIYYKDNNLNIMGQIETGEYKNFILKEDNTFLQDDLTDIPKTLLELENQEKLIMDIAYIDENTCAVLTTNFEGEKMTLEIIEANTKTIELTEGNYYGLFISDKGEIFILSNNMDKNILNRYDKTGNLIKEYEINLDNYFVAGNDIITTNLTENALIIYDLETGEEKLNIAKPNLDFSDVITTDQSGNIFICGKNGVEKLLKDTNEFEKIIDSNNTYLGLDTNFVNNIIATNENEYFILFDDSSYGSRLVKYTYDENINKNFKAELNVYMLQDNPFIKQAIFNYKKNNPDININVEVGYDEHNGITKEDAIKNLNKEILAGKGADIIILDGLDVENYIEKGALMDISDIIMPLVDKGELLENIVNPLVEDGKIYAIPTRFSPSTIWGDKQILDNYTNLDSLAKWQEQNQDKKVFYPTKPEKLIEKTFKTNTQIIDETGNINEEELKKYLENIKILSSNEDTGVELESELEENVAALEYLAYKDIQVHIQDMKSNTELEHSYASIAMNGNATYSLNNGYFTPLSIVGINSKSKHSDIAKEIIKTALSQETQQINILSEGGFSVNKAVFDKLKVAEDKEQTSAMVVMVGIDPDKQIDIINNVISDEEKVKFFETIEKVYKPTKEDSTLMNFIIEESKGYFKGEKDIDETTKAICQKAKTYLAE